MTTNKQSLRFPRGASLDDYKGTIRFDVLERVEINTDSLKYELKEREANLALTSEAFAASTQLGIAVTGIRAIQALRGSGVVGTALSDIAEGFKVGDAQLKALTSPEATRDFYNAHATRRSNKPTTKQRTRGSRGHCTLYLPSRISIGDEVSYDKVQLGRVGAAANFAFENTGDPVAAARTGLQEVGKTVGAGYTAISNAVTQGKIDLEGLGPNAAAFAISRLAGRGQSDRAAIVNRALGIALHPNEHANFESVTRRRFAFNFKLIPASLKEAEEIEQIIKFFRREIYPEGIPIGPIYAGYRYPRKFEITLAYADEEVATRILPSYLESFTTDYNPNSMSFHYRNGKAHFPEINISMMFQEERSLVAQDVEYGGY